MKKNEKKLITLGVIAKQLNQPLHKIEYIVRSRKISEISRAGKLRIFDDEAIEKVKMELAKKH